jgi:hypothetical protein
LPCRRFCAQGWNAALSERVEPAARKLQALRPCETDSVAVSARVASEQT